MKRNYVFLDTETDGLHIINNRPFSFQMAVGLKGAPIYYNINRQNIDHLIKVLSKPNTWLIGHNVKFDCHMLINMGVPLKLFRSIRIIDTMFMARIAIDHTDQAGDKYRGPISLSLTGLSKRYLGVDSEQEEIILKTKFKELNTEHKIKFRQWLISYLGKVVTTKELNELYNLSKASRLVSTYSDTLLDEIDNYMINNPKPTYKDIPPYVMEPYALKDIVLTRGLFIIFMDMIHLKQQVDIFIREVKAMYPLLLMEREGLTIDIDEAMKKYVELYNYREANNVILAPINLLKKGAQPIATYFDQTVTPSVKTNTVIYDSNLDVYFEYRKSDVIAIEGEPMNLRSSQQMAALYRFETGDNSIEKANKEVREEIEHISPSAKKIQLLRPLDKLIDTYLYRLINESIPDGQGNYKLYGTYNNMNDSYNKSDDTAGTVTGRLSSDLQQFPRDPLLDAQGNELVNIRKLFIVPKGKHSMWYFDMSQLELRLQTIWSAIINGSPDKTMARGFVPYNCHEQFNDDGTSKGWFLNEDPQTQWKPTDFHTITAEQAFSNMPDYNSNKSHYRSLGKRANFAISYGASKWKIIESLKVDEKTAESLIKGFKSAYVGLMDMEKYLRSMTKVQEYQTNLFGRRYYTREVHKLKNWLVQGSGGDLLKIFLARLVPFVEKYPHWKLMLTVHDEIDFVLDKMPTDQEIKEVLSIMFYTAGGIDVTSEPEWTQTSWGELSPYKII